MAYIQMTIGGLSLLVASKKEKTAEIAMLNPSLEHMLPSDRALWANHLPLLITRKEHVESIDGPSTPFPLDFSVEPEWFDGATSLDDFVGWAVQGADIKLRDRVVKVPKPGAAPVPAEELEFAMDPIELNEKGCKQSESWDSLHWIANSNSIFSQLRLADEWRESPHVGARFTLGPGRLSSEPPLIGNSGFLKIDFHGGLPSRPFTDAFRYDREMNAPSVLVDMAPRRWRLNLQPGAKPPIRVWLLSLDDELLAREEEPTEHFVLYSLLPWRFRTPLIAGACPPGNETQGGCINLSYFTD